MYTIHHNGIVGTYHGGQYVDLHFGSPKEPAFECINVWSGGERPENPPTRSEVKEQIVEWYDDNHDYLPDYRMTVA